MKRSNNHKHIRGPLLAVLAVGLANAYASMDQGPFNGPAHRASWGSRSAAPHTPTQRASWGSRATPPAPAVPHTAASTSVILKLADSGLTAARQAALTHLGADVTHRFDFIGSVAATVPHRSLARIAALPFVTHLSADGAVRKCDDFTDGDTGADVAHDDYSLDGTGVTVAVVDSGLASQSRDLEPQILDAVSFVPGDSSTDDTCGHGTHVAGIIGGNGARSTGPRYFRTFYGVARQAGLVNVRVLDQNGQGSVSSVLAGIQWVIDNKDTDGIGVMNLSLGHPVGESYKTDPLCQAVEAA